jgi:hypothetical protein
VVVQDNYNSYSVALLSTCSPKGVLHHVRLTGTYEHFYFSTPDTPNWHFFLRLDHIYRKKQFESNEISFYEFLIQFKQKLMMEQLLCTHTEKVSSFEILQLM